MAVHWFQSRAKTRAEKPAPATSPVGTRLLSRDLLTSALLGGPVGQVIDFSRYDLDAASLRADALAGRAAARDRREQLARDLGLEHGASLDDIGYRLGQRHRAGRTPLSRTEDPTARFADEIGLLALLSDGWTRAGDLPADASSALAQYHRGQGLLGLPARVTEALADGRRLAFEIPTDLLRGRIAGERDASLVRALALAAAASPENERLSWILPAGVGRAELDRFFAERPELAALQSRGNVVAKDSARLDAAVGPAYSVKRLLLEVQGVKDESRLAATDLFLLNRGEWKLDLSDGAKGLVKLLILLAGDVVFDATDRLADDVKRLNVVSTNA